MNTGIIGTENRAPIEMDGRCVRIIHVAVSFRVLECRQRVTP